MPIGHAIDRRMLTQTGPSCPMVTVVPIMIY